MSVRRGQISSGRRHQGGGWGVLRGIALWAFLLLGSFIFGMLVVSPMINAVHPSASETAPQAPPQSPATAPAPAQSETAATVAPSRDTQKPGLSVQPGIDVTPVRSAPVQKPESTESRTPMPAPPAQTTGANPTDSGSISVDSPSARSDRSDLSDSARDSRGSAADGQDTARRSRRRSRRHPPTDLSVQPEAAPGGPVQKGESIDQ